MNRLVVCLLAAFLPHAAGADTLLAGNHAIDGNLCVGPVCALPFNFTDTLTLRGPNLSLRFSDTSTGGFPYTSWRLLANDASSTGLPSFSVENTDLGRQPLRIDANAGDNTLFLAAGPRVGIGTSIPITNLHIAASILPGMRIEQFGGPPGFKPQIWDFSANDNSYIVHDTTAGTRPFRVFTGTPTDTLVLRETDRIGLGRVDPETTLHLWRDDGKAQARIEEASVNTTPRTLLDLRNNGRAELAMGNTATGGEWSFGAGTNFVMKFGAIGSRSPAKTKHLTLYSGSGDLEITGQIITTGPTCKLGCDAVFDAGYVLPSIADHARQMYALGRLPNVGPTRPGQAMNVSDKLGQILNELEHAHIYIAQLESRLAALEAARN